MRVIKEPGIFRRLLSEMGGRSFVIVSVFSMFVMCLATGLLFRAEFEPQHWLEALKWCAIVIGALLGKRIAEEVGESFGKR